MEEIIVIRARDPDGSVFKAVMDSLKGKRAEVVDVAAPATSVLRIGELEIHHKHRAHGGKGSGTQSWGVCHALLHGQFTRAGVLQSAAL